MSAIIFWVVTFFVFFGTYITDVVRRIKRSRYM